MTNPAHETALVPLAEGRDGVRFYENAIPERLARDMDARYGALYSSVAYLRMAGRLGASTSTYAACVDGAIRAVFLVEREGPVLKVLNGAITVAPEEVERFAAHVFSTMPGIDKICFPGLHTAALQLPYPYQRFFAGEDIVIAFPGTAEEYTQALGKNTRKSIKRHATALAKRHPGAHFEVVTGTAIDARLGELVAGWNRRRMAGKDKVSSYDAAEVRRISALAARDGLVGTIRIDGRVCAGTVCCRVGDTIYLAVMGHDADFDAFSLGLLCNYWTTLACLRTGCREINLMGGRLPYKYSLLGEPRRYDRVILYRDRGALLRNVQEAMRTALRGHATDAKRWVLDCERRGGPLARSLAHALAAWRRCRLGLRRTRKRLALSTDCVWMTVAMEVAGSVPLP